MVDLEMNIPLNWMILGYPCFRKLPYPNIQWESLTHFNPSHQLGSENLESGSDEAPSIGWHLRCGEGPNMMRRCGGDFFGW